MRIKEYNKTDIWFVIPPYKNEGWQIVNEIGEHVATFETKEDCLKAVNCVNQISYRQYRTRVEASLRQQKKIVNEKNQR